MHLCVTNETGLRSVVRVGVGTGESESSVPCIGGGLVAGSEGENVSLCGQACCDSGITGATDVAELIADAVGDDVGVQGLLLTLVDNWVNGLECELSVLAAVQSSLKLDGWCASSEIIGGNR